MSRQAHGAWFRSGGLAFGLWLLVLGGSSPARAQTNDEVGAGLQFDLTPPGARSLAMGNAFVGLADDATAAYANPAGLLWLTRSEISVEGRYRRNVQRYPDSGSASGEPRGFGIDTRADLTFSERGRSNAGIGFLSYVMLPHDRWRVAFYRHELARFDAAIDSQGPFIRSGNSRSRLAAVRAELALDIVSYGVSSAVALNEQLWLGFGLSLYDFHLDATTRRYLTVVPYSSVSLAIFNEVPLIPANERDRHLQHGDDTALAGIAGLLWRGASGKVSAGLVYRQAPRFDLDYRFEWQQRASAVAAGDSDGDGVIDRAPNLDWIDPGPEEAMSGRTDFEIPDMLSLGFAWRPSAAFTLSLQVDRVGYSRLDPKANLLFDGLENVADCGTYDASGQLQEPVPCLVDRDRLARFDVPDTTQWHVGAEYVLAGRVPLALRAGAWYEPDHRLVFRDASSAPEDRLAARFRPGDDALHGTLGLGLVFRKLQLDLGLDVGEQSEMLSASTVYRF